MNLRQAAQQLQLPKKRLRDLIAHKVVCPLVHGPQAKAASRVIARKHVTLLFIPANSSAQGATENVRRILRCWMLSAEDGVVFIEALIDGALPAYCTDLGSVPVGAAAVGTVEASVWLQKRRSEHRIGLTVLPLVDAQAVCGPCVDGQRQYFFARSAVLHLTAIEHPLKGSSVRG